MAQARERGLERRLAPWRGWLMLLLTAVSVLLMDLVLQAWNAQRAPHGLLLLSLRQRWRDPWQRDDVAHMALCYIAAALVAWLLAYALLPELEPDPQATDRRLARQVIEASVGELKRSDRD